MKIARLLISVLIVTTAIGLGATSLTMAGNETMKPNQPSCATHCITASTSTITVASINKVELRYVMIPTILTIASILATINVSSIKSSFPGLARPAPNLIKLYGHYLI